MDIAHMEHMKHRQFAGKQYTVDFSGWNTDGSFTTAVSKSFLSSFEKI